MVTVLRAAVIVLLIVLAAVTFTPLVWLLAAALKAPEDLFSYTFFSPNPSLKNFYDLFTQVDFLRFVANSVFVACAGVVIQLFFSSLAGYALAKYQFKGKHALTLLMLATLLIPGQVTLAPTYELIYRMGLVDTYAGLLVPGAVSVFGIFLFRQAMLSVPDELIQAARLDGCSEFQIYWQIVVPTVRPMVGAFVLIAFMGQWNSFLWPQIILHSAERFTLPIALTQMVGIYQQQYGMLMAGTLLSILPVMALFLFLQREFVAGLTAGAVKG
ncbi:MAG: carbohydrate ABC transporter permease [Fimbriimonadales bacterium]|nr:carbohydrate ABC transporter permease [Fimbriimonadales bacterium]